MARQTVLEYLANFESHGSQPAYLNRRSYRKERWTYVQIAASAYQFARELQARELKKGDRLMLWGENCAEWVIAFLGSALCGVVVVPMDNAGAADFALRVHAQIDSKLLVCARGHVSAAPSVPTIVLQDLPEVLARHASLSYQPATVGRDDPLEIVFTSGTTAEPKGVVISHGNVLSNIEPLESEMQKYLKWERFVHPIRFLNLLPLSHVFGQFLGIFLPQLLGATVIFQDVLSPSEITRTIKRERVSVLVAVPRMLQSLKEKIEHDLEDQGRIEAFRTRFQSAEGKHFLRRWWIFRRVHSALGWKFWAFVCGGATLDRATEEFWARLGYAVIQGYGLTETTSLISVNHPFKLGKGSVGKVLAGREIKLSKEGEILVRGGGVASGYWSGHQLTPVASDEGWYHTGDIGELDAAGNLYFKGRKKNVIVTSAGMNIYPEDIEPTLRQQPGVRDCVVIAAERNGNAEACAVLILRDKEADPELMVRRANESLAEYQRIRSWFLWPGDDFPRTSTQKPKMIEIQRTVEAGLSQQKLDIGDGELAKIIARITRRSPAKMPADANLATDLNLSSLERVELMSALEERYQVDLSETSFAAANTVGDLENILHGKAAPRAYYHYPRWALRWPITWIRLLAHYLLLRPAVYLLGWPQIRGRENLRAVSGPILVICNHIDDVDVGFVLVALPARFRHRLAAAAGGESMEALRIPSATRSWFGKLVDRTKWFLGAALLNIFPLPREAGFRESFQYAGDAVDRGYSVLVFPEGRHTTTGELLPFRAGIGILVNELKIPVVPMRIDGLFELKQAGKKFAAPGRISLSIGSPLKFEVGHNPEEIARQLETAVAELGKSHP
jgi:long-chain acyl-CoA synthetase